MKSMKILQETSIWTSQHLAINTERTWTSRHALDIVVRRQLAKDDEETYNLGYLFVIACFGLTSDLVV